MVHKHIWVEQIEILKDRLAEATPNCIAQYSLAPGGSGPGDQTANIALRRAHWEQEKGEKERALQELEKAMKLLTGDQRNIIELRYIKGLQDYHIYDYSRIPAGKTLYYELRDDAIRTMAKCLGFLKS